MLFEILTITKMMCTCCTNGSCSVTGAITTLILVILVLNNEIPNCRNETKNVHTRGKYFERNGFSAAKVAKKLMDR